MTTGISEICPACGQPNGAHLPICPNYTSPPPEPAPLESPEMQHLLGQAV